MTRAKPPVATEIKRTVNKFIADLRKRYGQPKRKRRKAA